MMAVNDASNDSSDDPITHEINLDLSSGARLKLLYFSDCEMRWIFSYNYIGEKKRPGAQPEIVNDVKLTADYHHGELTAQFVLSMHIIVPARLGQQSFAGIDISPGAKTYLEFTYDRDGDTFRLVELCKGAHNRVRLDEVNPAIMRPIEFPFPVSDHIALEFGKIHVPFLTNQGQIANFVLPTRTLR